MSFAVVTDSASNLMPEHLQAYHIYSSPLSYIVDGVATPCPPLDEFDGEAFYKRISEGLAVQTSLSNTAQFTELFESLLKQGQDILYVGLSAGISGTCQAAELAARDLHALYPERLIFVVNSKAASMGEGLLAIRAAQLRDAGYSINSAVIQLERERETLHQIFTVEDLMHLRRGGRISTLTAAVGSVLHIRPLLIGVDGCIVSCGKARGRKGALKALFEDYCSKAAKGGSVSIAHAAAPEDAAKLAAEIQAYDPDCSIITVMYEPVTGAHVGPGALALFYFDTIQRPVA